MKKFIMLVAVSIIVGGLHLQGCKSDSSSMSKEEASELAKSGKSDSAIDYCVEFGWYGDGECDQDLIDDGLCIGPDSDCTGNNICGGIAALQCGDGQWCKITENYPDASGTCLDVRSCEDTNDCTTQEESGLLPSLSTCAEGIPANFVCIENRCTGTCGSTDNACINAGGTCIPLDPDGCPEGDQPIESSCGADGAIGLMCCVREQEEEEVGKCETVDDCYRQVDEGKLPSFENNGPCTGEWQCNTNQCEWSKTGCYCGGFAGFECPDGQWCKMTESYPDATGECKDIRTCDTTDDCTAQENAGLLPSLSTCEEGIPANRVCINNSCTPTCGSTDNACVTAGGTCSPVDPDGCPEGKEPIESSCGVDGAVGLMCCK